MTYTIRLLLGFLVNEITTQYIRKMDRFPLKRKNKRCPGSPPSELNTNVRNPDILKNKLLRARSSFNQTSTKYNFCSILQVRHICLLIIFIRNYGLKMSVKVTLRASSKHCQMKSDENTYMLQQLNCQ
jgi:hypothetical protein